MVKPKALENLGIESVADLIHHFQRRHEDRRRLRPIETLRDGEMAIVRGVIERVKMARLRNRKSFVEATVCDETGAVKVRWWNQPWLSKSLEEGMEIILFGKLRKNVISSPEYEVLLGESSLHAGRIVPIYPLTRGVSAPGLRRAIHTALDEVLADVEDPLPEEIRQRRNLPPLPEALRDVHFPDNRDALERAKSRLRYDELFYYELAMALQRAHTRRQEGVAHKWSRKVDERIRARFPFALTAAQDRTIVEILQDLRAEEPMSRLLQGDVASGKTAVALYAALVVIANRAQVAFLAPTEILARQHLATLRGLLEGSDVNVQLLVGSTPQSERKVLLNDTKMGAIDLIVGTHALLEPTVEFKNLGLIVVDEQHKFGVAQRARLIRKGKRPDVLVMTATPIPRTLAL